MYKKFFLLIAVMMLFLVSNVSAASNVELEAAEGKIKYAFEMEDTQFVILEYSAPDASGKQVVYAEDGLFEGDIQLPWSGRGGNVKLTVKNLKNHIIGSASVKLLKDDAYQVPEGNSNAKVEALVLTETVDGFAYSFKAEGTDFVLLQFRNKQESGQCYIFPNETGVYEGEIVLPLTYARTLTTVKICTGKKTVKKEATVRKAYQISPAPAQTQGRLSGLVVCVDPGHQENGKIVREPIGPGLPGYITGTGGMAQGKVTLRKESIVVMEIAEKLRDELIRQGATVVMTREVQDVFHTNMQRCQIAEEAGAFIMLRLHADTRQNTSKRGLSIYTPLNSDYAKAVASTEEYKEMGQLMLDAMKKGVGYQLDTTTGYVHMDDDFVGNNWAKMICFLIEMGYMSNVQDEHLLSHPVYQQWLAEGMAQGVYEIAVYRELIDPES